MMPDEKFEIRGIAVFFCRKSENVFERTMTLTLEELKMLDKKIEKIFRENIIGTPRFKGILNNVLGRSTRIHRFSDKSILSIFRELLENNEVFEENATKLARGYYNFKKSHSTAIFIFTIRAFSHRYVVVYSSGYLESVARLSEEGNIEDYREVSFTDLKKSIIYPYQSVNGKLHYDKAKVSQKGSYATYWLRAFGLETERRIKSTPRIFLSHSSKDNSFVKNLAVKLRSDGFSVWYDDWEIHVGDSIVQKINKGISTSDFLIIVLSKNSVNSKWVREELNAATTKNISSKGAFILPVLLEECEIPPLLSGKRYANFSEDPESAYQKLVESINYHSKTNKR